MHWILIALNFEHWDVNFTRGKDSDFAHANKIKKLILFTNALQKNPFSKALMLIFSGQARFVFRTPLTPMRIGTHRQYHHAKRTLSAVL
jgi:hypothetical protein